MSYAFPPVSERCFLDANIFYYDVIAHGAISDYCNALFREVAAGQRRAATTVGALAGAVHKVMFTEPATFFGRPRAGMLSWFKTHPEGVQELSIFRAAAERYAALPLEILDVDEEFVQMAADVSAAIGLLTNDAIIAVAMEVHEVRHLVTNDDDFDRLPGITVWKPR